ncbi:MULTISPECIES: motility associated factor glycosyltransferase family protein [unclassified Pseudomonas]|uniref:motility associated factor glycosyltransferase family protein n=1 Tax=unclassified Pseudomonas TaxID=196821 RepID=UPI000A1E5372|nr:MULTISPECIES: 6-hydroxymethylpterin diphosphokinase MptE-like protein [unclassified Pseudomonas]MDI2145597.1 motility associated factor glycosyltransferase family protein [Pseudomonas sp. ITA]
MSEFFQANANVIERRWPALSARLLNEDSSVIEAGLTQGLGSTLNINGIQLTSRHDRVHEARIQAASLPADKSRLHVYGTGLGDLPTVLLERAGLERLYVHILNGALFALVLQLIDQQQWLEDPRVELLYAGDLPDICTPFFALPAEMLLADDFNAKIRDRLVSEVHLSFNNREFDPQSPFIQQRLQDCLPVLLADDDVAQLFGTCVGREIYVIGTGPTLEQHFERLTAIRERDERPVFICVDTAYRPLREHGIVPDYVVSIDQRISFRHLPFEESDGIPLVYLPMSDPEVLRAWRGKRYGGYSLSPVYAALREQHPRALLHVGGSVIHPAVDLAVKMGAARITLFGADFAFPMNKTHAGWGDGDLGPSVNQARHWVRDGFGERVSTQLNFRGYLCVLERYIASQPQVEFFNSSRAGALIAGTRFNQEFVQ